MTWPPRHRILVGDVEPVEIINAAHDGINTARSRVYVEHMRSRPGLHLSYFTPLAAALVEFPGTASKASTDPASVFVRRAWGPWEQQPTWSPHPIRALRFSLTCQQIVGIRTHIAATNYENSFGIPTFVDTNISKVGWVRFHGTADKLDGLNALYIMVYAIP